MKKAASLDAAFFVISPIVVNGRDTTTMCGRFTIDIPAKLLAKTFGLAEPPTILPRYNIAPTPQIPVIRQYAVGQNHLDYLRWGLIPSWAKDKSIGNMMINARSETLPEKPAFKQSVRYRRCVVVA